MARQICPLMKTDCMMSECALWNEKDKECALLALSKCMCRCDNA